MEATTPVERPGVSPGTNPERKQQSVRFKAAHALMVAFFLMILQVHISHFRYPVYQICIC